ncbi:hypothetical protein CKY51_21440 [Xanthomonas maliensis]|nr:hypothetical protein CKY51_21440 [Xanthomonas maliensis]
MLAILLAGYTGAAMAEPPSHPCAEVAGSAARLACYDAAFPPTQAAIAAEAAVQQGRFGRAPVVSTATVERISASVRDVSYLRDGSRSVLLDNQQRWLLTEPGGRGPLVPGEQVEIRKAALGSYLLITHAGVALRARRVE